MMRNPHPDYRADIDGLRAVAVLGVLLYHFFPHLLPGGFVGVDVFFVISGFLISTIIFESLAAGRFGFQDFYVRRVNRIFPALAVVLLCTIFVGWIFLLPGEFSLLGKHVATSAGFVQNLALLSESGYFDVASEYKPLLHIWSLGVEEQFYFVFPVLLVLAWKINKRLVPWLIIFLAVGSFVLNYKGAHSLSRNAASTFFLPHTRFWELFVGSLLAYFGNMKASAKLLLPLSSFFRGSALTPRFRNIISAIGLCAILLSFLVLNSRPFPGLMALFPVVGAALLILAGPDTLFNRVVLSNRLVVAVGIISYPLYLWHWPLVSFLRIYVDGEVGVIQRLSAIAVSFVLAALTYAYVERPIRFGGGRPLKKTISLAVCVGAVGVVGYVIHSAEGFPSESYKAAEQRVRWDAEWLNSVGCRAKFKIDDSLDYCVSSANSDGSILLIGDSHSNHLWPGLERRMPDRLLAVAHSGCPPFPGLAVGPCLNHMATIYDYAENKNNKTVVLSGFDLLYYSGHGIGRDSRRVSIRLGSDRDVKGRDAYLSAMESGLDRLVRKGKAIVFVIDIPELGFDPRACLSTMPLTGLPKRAQCAIPRSAYEQRRIEFVQMIKPVLRKFPTVVTFDPSEVLCDADYCWAGRDDRLLYRDSDHLSLEGSLVVASGLVKAIQEAEQRVYVQ